MTTFTETQRFQQWWIWAIAVGIPFWISFMLPFSITGLASSYNWLFNLLLFAPISISFLVWRLDTRYDSEGIHYRVFPFMSWRIIAWSNVKKAYIRQYDFVGYGVRSDLTTWYYNVGGNQGLQIIKTDSSQIVFGTQRPDELQAFLDTNSTLITT